MQVYLPFGGREGWHVLASDEVFFDFFSKRWDQNRAQAGGGARLNSRLFLDVYFLQRDAHGAGLETHVVGTTLFKGYLEAEMKN